MYSFDIFTGTCRFQYSFDVWFRFRFCLHSRHLRLVFAGHRAQPQHLALCYGLPTQMIKKLPLSPVAGKCEFGGALTQAFRPGVVAPLRTGLVPLCIRLCGRCRGFLLVFRAAFEKIGAGVGPPPAANQHSEEQLHLLMSIRFAYGC